MRPRIIAALVVAGPLVLARPAQADDAGALFDQGLADMAAHRYDVACPKLAESFRLDPHAGGLFTLAECENKAGKLAAARVDYQRFLDLAKQLPPKERPRQEPRVKVAHEQLAALERDLPHVTVSLDAAAPPGSTVLLDGAAFTVPSPPAPTAVDPGDHVVTVHAPDGRTHDEHVSLGRGETRTVILTLPEPLVAPPPPGAAPPSDGTSTRTILTYATAGVGGALVVTGAILGGVVFANKKSIDAGCPTPTTCTSSSAASTGNTTRTLAAASTGTFIAGGAALAGAAILWLTAPKAEAPPAAAEPHLGTSLRWSPIVAPTIAERGVMVGLDGAW